MRRNLQAKALIYYLGGQVPLVSDPFTLAINSIRGQALELFTLAVELDRENDDSFESVELSADIKKLYKYLLRKNNLLGQERMIPEQ